MRNTALVDGIVRSVHVGLLRNRSQARKTRRVESAGFYSGRGKNLGVRDWQRLVGDG
jgi:hypothetical protein